MEDKLVGCTDRKSQLFFPVSLEKQNVEEYVDSHSYDSQDIFEEFLHPPAILPNGSRLVWSGLSEYLLPKGELDEMEYLSNDIVSPTREEHCEIFQKHVCNFAPTTTTLKEFSSISHPSFSKSKYNVPEDCQEEIGYAQTSKRCRKKQVKQSSLFDLTVLFFEILLHSPDGIVDLNVASRKLNVRKRRLYDVLNVCEGVGILDKANRNCVKLTGNSTETISNMKRFWYLHRQLKKIEEEERKIDFEVLARTQFESSLEHNCSNYRPAVLSSNNNQKKLLVEAPVGSILNVLKPKLSRDGLQWLYQIAIKSAGGRIAYRFLSKLDDDSQHEYRSSSTQVRNSFNLTKYWPCENVSMSTSD